MHQIGLLVPGDASESKSGDDAGEGDSKEDGDAAAAAAAAATATAADGADGDAAATDATEGADAGDGEGASGAAVVALPKPTSTLSALHATLVTISEDKSMPSAVRADAIEAIETGLDLFLPDPDARTERTLKLLTDDAVVEFQLAWPCNASDDDGKQIQFERLLLLLQFHCKRNKWKFRLLGRWPALVYLVVEVPASPGVATFLNQQLQGVCEQAGIDDWTFPDGLVSPELPIRVIIEEALSRSAWL